MQIAQVLAGYTLGEADLLRRAMGKKKPEEMAEHRDVFVDGATSRGVDKRQATHIFDLMEKFAGYGFNKSHSAAYALLSYQTAWMKTHHPAAFMAAVLSADMDSTDKVVNFVEESAGAGSEPSPPHVNECVYRFSVADERRVRYGLGAIKGAGEAALEGVIEERSRNGPYHRPLRLHPPHRPEAGQSTRARSSRPGRRARRTGAFQGVDDADLDRGAAGRGAAHAQPSRPVRTTCSVACTDR